MRAPILTHSFWRIKLENKEVVQELKKEPISLKSLLAPSKTVEFEYPGMEDFKIKLTYLAREELLKLRNKCVTNKFNKKTRAYEEEFDADKFLPQYIKAVIKGWTGLKYKYLEELLLVDTSGVEDEDCLEFTEENCEVLIKNSNDFNTWVTEQVGDLENFTERK